MRTSDYRVFQENMNFALVYLIQRFFYRISNFLHHWYSDASKVFFHKFISFLEYVDRTVALRVTLRYFFHPLFKDYTFMGRILGVIFRSGRVLMGAAVYAFILMIFLIAYLSWLAAPVVLIFYVLGAK